MNVSEIFSLAFKKQYKTTLHSSALIFRYQNSLQLIYRKQEEKIMQRNRNWSLCSSTNQIHICKTHFQMSFLLIYSTYQLPYHHRKIDILNIEKNHRLYETLPGNYRNDSQHIKTISMSYQITYSFFKLTPILHR